MSDGKRAIAGSKRIRPTSERCSDVGWTRFGPAILEYRHMRYTQRRDRDGFTPNRRDGRLAMTSPLGEPSLVRLTRESGCPGFRRWTPAVPRGRNAWVQASNMETSKKSERATDKGRLEDETALRRTHLFGMRDTPGRKTGRAYERMSHAGRKKFISRTLANRPASYLLSRNVAVGIFDQSRQRTKERAWKDT